MTLSRMSALSKLALGAIAGALCGVWVLMAQPDGGDLEPDVVASVNGSPLDLAQYQRAVRLYASEKRSPVTSQDRTLILERMIEEELLRQHGVATGLVRSDPQVRAEVLQSVMTSLTAQLDAGEAGQGSAVEASSEALARYLGQLRSGATIRWTASGAGQ